MKVEIDTEEVWSASEIAVIANVSPQAISQWQKRNILGTPMYRIKGMPLWSTDQVRDLLADRKIDIRDTLKRVNALARKLDAK